MKNRKFLNIGLICLGVVLSLLICVSILNLSINRALINDAQRTGVNWSKHIAHHIPDVGNAENVRYLENIEASLRTENLARLALDIVNTSDVFQIDFVNSDCYCSISLGAYLAKQQTPQREIVIKHNHIKPKKNQKHSLLHKAETALPTHVSHQVMAHVLTSTKSHEPRQRKGKGLYQTKLEWKKAAKAITAKETKTYINDGNGTHAPNLYAEVFYPVQRNGEAVYMIRTLMNLEASAASYSFYHYGGFALMLMLLLTCFIVPARNYWVTKEQKVETEERAAYFESYDPLTKLLNRSALHKAAEALLQTADNESTTWALTLIELRNLAEINDVSNHEFGDTVLQAMAEQIEIHGGESSTLGRISGTTFAILMPQDVLDRQKKLLESSLKRGFQLNIEGRKVVLQLNSGTALYPQHTNSFDNLLRDAALTLQQAREMGANIHRVFAPDFASAHRARAALKRSFKNAILAQQIMPYYQPIIDSNNGQLVGLEALARWNHPEKGVLSPASFYTALDDPEISAMLGKEMIKLVTGHMGYWKAEQVPFGYIGININDGDLNRKGFVLETAKALADNGLYGPNLSLEVSENCIFGDKKDEYVEKLTLLKSAGCRIALDDFGTGYSSISQLKQIPFDTVKIDRSYIIDLEESPKDRAIVKALNDLSQSMKFKLIAEGVETEKQLETTKELGVSLIQGFLFAEPMPMTDVATFIKTAQLSETPAKIAS